MKVKRKQVRPGRERIMDIALHGLKKNGKINVRYC